MTLSRTARFLIAALLVAAAAFVWVNYFNQDPLAPATQATDPTAPVALGDNVGAAPSTAVPSSGEAGVATDTTTEPLTATGDDAATATPAADAASPVAGDEAASGTDTAEGAAGTPAAAVPTTTDGAPVATTAPAVVVTDGPTVVTRDLVVDVLPFLVTSPPQPGAGLADEDGEGLARPQVTQRSSINPFSPVVVQAPPAAPVSDVVASNEPPPSESPVIEVVEAPAGPPGTAPTTAATQQVVAEPTPVAAPAPRAVTPSSTLATNLPRALPAGMLPSTPEILRDTRSQAALVTPVVPDLAAIAALKEPTAVEDAVELQAVASDLPSDDVVTPEIIGVARPQESAPEAAAPLPLAVGADPLSRYLRDNDVRFTGTVLGPLSVGVFRSSLYGSPVVLTLGQPLPETDILLSDLRGYEARFSLGDRTQTLSLDLRR